MNTIVFLLLGLTLPPLPAKPSETPLLAQEWAGFNHLGLTPVPTQDKIAPSPGKAVRDSPSRPRMGWLPLNPFTPNPVFHVRVAFRKGIESKAKGCAKETDKECKVVGCRCIELSLGRNGFNDRAEGRR